MEKNRGLERRDILKMAAVGGLVSAVPSIVGTPAGAATVAKAFAPPGGPRSRVLYLNDLSGDIDGLFATVHTVLSNSTDVRGIIGTGPNSEDPGHESAASAAEIAGTILSQMGRAGSIPIFEGSASRLKSLREPVRSPGVDAIIREALRTDSQLPLYITVGGGLTEVASAILIEPSIASRFTLVWIGGGPRHPEFARLEPNFSIDPLAAQYIFNETTVPLWQVPSTVYQTCVVSDTELQAFVAPCGQIGGWLFDQVVKRGETYRPFFNPGETWTLGDNPLIALTALNDWVPSARTSERGPFIYGRTGSSAFQEVPAPRLDAYGAETPRENGRTIRRYTSIDNRLLLGDFFAKLRVNYL